MPFTKANFLYLFLLLFILPQISFGKLLKNRTKKKEIAVIDNSAYKILQDTVVINNELEIHNDTIFNKKYEFKKIILSSKVITDTIWQDANVYSVNFRTENQYDYIPTDPAYGYTGKIKMIKPYKFFRPSEVLNKPRVAMVAGMQGGLYAAANTWWSTAWYAKTEKGKFRFFNDWGEWNQMDKLGHIYSCYIESKWTYDLFRWAGVKEKHAIWVGMVVGNMWQLSIELNDGFQKKWGFSWGDMLMNASGSLLFGIQQYVWHDQRINMKMSAFPVNYSKYNDPLIKERADKLYGTSFTESLLKDYNAMTLWWSISPGAFIRNPKSKFPKCLQVSFGYGAAGMLGGYKNIWNKNDLSGDQDLENVDPTDLIDRTEIQRLQRFYFSFDIDWTKLPVKKHWAKGLMKVLNVIKLPAPAIEFNNNKNGSKVAWHWLKF
jgi:hypothetical protein